MTIVGRQEHSPIRARAQRGFSILRDQVLVLYSGQELGLFAENGQEPGTIADLITIKYAYILVVCPYNKRTDCQDDIRRQLGRYMLDIWRIK